MDNKIPGGEAMANPDMEGGDWRTELQPESRQMIVNEISETLERHLPSKGEDGLQEIKNIAVRFEDRIYTAATSRQDYLRKFSLKMLAMKCKAPSNSRNSHDSGSQNASLNNISSTGVPNSLGGMSQGTMPGVHGKNPNMQNMSYVTVDAVSNSMGQGMQKIDERKLLLLNKLWSDIHLCVALAETSTERLLEFSKAINEQKEILTVEQPSSSTSLNKKQKIEAFCGSALDEIAIHPLVQSENKRGGKRKKSGQEKSIQEKQRKGKQ